MIREVLVGLSLAALVALAGCAPEAHAPRPAATPPPPPSPAEPAVTITLEHEPSSDAWRATYRFAAPVVASRFLRAGYEFRPLLWRVVQPAGVRIERSAPAASGAGAEPEVRMTSADGAAFREVVVEVPTYIRDGADYDLFKRFTDGSVLVFTGHFDVMPLVCRRKTPCGPTELEDIGPAAHDRFVLESRAGEHLVLQGVAHAERAVAWDSDDDGTWAYFGGVAPVDSDQLVAVLDPGLPAWLSGKLSKLLPDIFTYYAARTRQRLSPKPVVYLDLTTYPGPTTIGIGGGTRPGNVQLSVDLGTKYMHEEGPIAVERVAYLFAHEGAHLWNNDMFPQDGGRNDWMHEGGADAFAFRALLHFGIYDRAAYDDKLSEALSTCLLALAGRPVDALGDLGRYDGYYACGSTIALWTEAAVQRAHPEMDLFDFWSRLFVATAASHHYDDALYYRTLASLGGDAAATAVRAFVEEPRGDAATWLSGELAKVGLAAVVVATPVLPRRYEEIAGGLAVTALVEQDCGSANGRIAPNGEGYELLDASGCKHLAKGFVIAALGGSSVNKQGAAAYDHLVGRCQAGQDVEVTPVEGEAVRVPCQPLLAPRPPYLHVSSSGTAP